MENFRGISLRWGLALIIFLSLLVPSSIIVALAYQAMYAQTRDQAILAVGAASQSRYESLKLRLQAIQGRTDTALIELQKNCVSFTTNPACYKTELLSLLAHEDAETVILLAPDGAPLLLGANPTLAAENIVFAKDQLAYFTPRVAGSIPSFFLQASQQSQGGPLRLLIGFSVSQLQAIFNYPKELGHSGETFLANSKGYFITSARYKSVQGHGVDPISARPMKRCLSPENAETLDLDYRDVPIIHGFRFVPEIGGGCIMAHVDQAEAFAPASKLRTNALLAVALLAALGAVLALVLSKRIVRPLQAVTTAISDFDLHASLSGETPPPVGSAYREIAALESSFLSMAAKLSFATKDTEALLSALNFHAIVSSTDRDGSITHVNDIFCRISGYSADELLGSSHSIVNSGMHSRAFWQSVWTRISSGNPWHGEICNRAKDGHLYWVDTVIVPYKNASNVIEKYVSIRFDISASKNSALALHAANEQTRAALEELCITEERHKFAIEGSGDGVWDWDIPNNTVLLSPRWKSMLGYTEDEIGTALSEWTSRLHPEDHAKLMAELQKNLDGKSSLFSSQHRVRCKDGSYLWVLNRGKVVSRDALGKPLRMIGTHADISKQKQMDRIKTEFISTVSHELRTPITSIRGALGLLEAGVLGTLPAKALDLVKVAHRNSQRLITLVNDILDMDKLLSGKLPLHLEPVSLQQLIQDAISANAAYASQYQVNYHYSAEADDYLVRADANRLRQVLDNLMSNAAKFSHPGAQVHLRVRQQNQEIVVEVEDYGSGIPVEFQDKVFEAFAQADSGDTRQQGSTGLGLNIAKKLITMMGGDIGFTSAQGLGTKFWFTIPLAKQAEPGQIE
jgi:PAS domain S-box-containing protein